MRSRYSAYVHGFGPYLLDSWHVSTRPQGPLIFEPGLKWLGLQIMRSAHTSPDHAEVEFVARSQLGGRAHRLHENSRFVREAGRWFYVDGDLS
jgi:SEC-C motif-containing protein